MTVTELGKPATGDHEAEEARLRRELAAVYRLIAHFKMTDLIYNHISVRLPGAERRFLLNPYGLLYEEITAASLVIVGLDGQLITDGPWRVNPARLPDPGGHARRRSGPRHAAARGLRAHRAAVRGRPHRRRLR